MDTIKADKSSITPEGFLAVEVTVLAIPVVVTSVRLVSNFRIHHHLLIDDCKTLR